MANRPLLKESIHIKEKANAKLCICKYRTFLRGRIWLGHTLLTPAFWILKLHTFIRITLKAKTITLLFFKKKIVKSIWFILSKVTSPKVTQHFHPCTLYAAVLFSFLCLGCPKVITMHYFCWLNEIVSDGEAISNKHVKPSGKRP